jgi:flagellar biosynthesis GTPase FlhF
METQIEKPETQPLEMALDVLRAQAKGIVINSREDCEKYGRLLTAIDDYKKDVTNKLNPFVEFARRGLDAARQEMQKHLNGAEELRGVVSTPIADFNRKERLAAEAETRRENDERRRKAEADAAEVRKQQEEQARLDREKREKEIKAAQKEGDLNKREAEKMRKEAEAREKEQREQAARDAAAAAANVQEVTVQPSTVKVTGARGRVRYFAEFTDFDALLLAYTKTFSVSYALSELPAVYERRAYLRRFIMSNDQELGKEARETKDSKKLAAAIPGIRACDEDRI